MAREDDDSSAFFASAALQLLEDKVQLHRRMTGIVPALQELISDPRVARTAAGDAVARFLEQLQAVGEAEPVLDADDSVTASRRDAARVVKSGWLRKASGSAFTVHTRWVVLDGTTLSYFKNKSETDLRGVLQLHGARVVTPKRLLPRVTSHSYAFEIHAGAPPHRRSVVGVTRDGGDASLFTGVRSGSNEGSDASDVGDATPLRSGGAPAGPGGMADVAPLNPLHESKRVYTWLCASAAERDEWVHALEHAITTTHVYDTARRWSSTFTRADTATAYRRAALAYARAHTVTPLCLSADWVRVHETAAGVGNKAAEAHTPTHAHSWGLRMFSRVHADGEGDAAAAAPSSQGMPLVVLPHDSHSTAATHAVAASPRNPKLARAFAVHTHTDALVHALSCVEASAIQRLSGFTPGDRVTLRQLGRDFTRDSVRLGLYAHAATYVNADASTLVHALCAYICGAMNRAYTRMVMKGSSALNGGGSSTGPRRRCAPSLSSLMRLGARPALDARLCEYAHMIMSCVSRTVAGGDTHDAARMMCANAHVHICAHTRGRAGLDESATVPVHIYVCVDGVPADADGDTPRPSSSEDVPLATTSEDHGMFSDDDDSGSSEDDGSLPQINAGVPLPPPATPSRVGSSDATPALPSKPPGSAYDLLPRMHVYAHTATHYRMVWDGEDCVADEALDADILEAQGSLPLALALLDEESVDIPVPTRLDACASMRVAPEDLGVITGTFARTFPWGKHPPSASISLQVTPFPLQMLPVKATTSGTDAHQREAHRE